MIKLTILSSDFLPRLIIQLQGSKFRLRLRIFARAKTLEVLRIVYGRVDTRSKHLHTVDK